MPPLLGIPKKKPSLLNNGYQQLQQASRNNVVLKKET